MLNIYFGNMEEAIYNPAVYFKNTYQDSWITNERSECTRTGKRVCRCGRYHRNHPDKNGWNSKGWNRRCNPFRTWHSGKIYRSRGDDRGSAEIRFQSVCECII